MAVLEQDIKLVKSAVMLDVPEGGGPPSSNVIVDGASNAIFDDISELARAGGNVSMRKVHAVVQTANTDGFFGANVIVAEPPSDPRVSVTLFSLNKTFDTRLEAQTRIEAYLNKGAQWYGYLWEDHIAGQRIIQIFCRPSDQEPVVGQTLTLIWNENLVTEREQYIRATAVSSTLRLFYDPKKQEDYLAKIVTINLSDVLRYDFYGAPANRSFDRLIAWKEGPDYDTRLDKKPTITRDTTVADAGSYVGVVPLTDAAQIGNFTINCEGIYSQLVPSAQTETAIADARPTNQSFALVPLGDAVSQSLTFVWTTTQQLYVGGAIMPASFTLVRSGVTLTDDSGVLYNGSSQVGTIDYENGILSLSTNVWGTSGGTHDVTYTPAAKFEGSLKSSAKRISQSSRSLSHAWTLLPAPKPGSLTLSYQVSRKWYVLRDYGNGKLVGLDTSYGAGTINFTTGTVLVTLGALPDVGSSLIFQWVETSSTEGTAAETVIRRYSRWGNQFVINDATKRSITPSGFTMQWQVNGVNKVCSDDGFGNLTGDALGRVDYSNGTIWWFPYILPAKDTIMAIDVNGGDPSTKTGVNIFEGLILPNLQPGSVSFTYPVLIQYSGNESQLSSSNSLTNRTPVPIKAWYLLYNSQGTLTWHYTGGTVIADQTTTTTNSSGVSKVNQDLTRTIFIRDNANGKLVYDEPGSSALLEVGTIDYATGEINLYTDLDAPNDDLLGPTLTFSSAGTKASSVGAPGGSSGVTNFQNLYQGVVGTSDSKSATTTLRWNDARELVNGSRKFIFGTNGFTVTVNYRTAGFSQDSLSLNLATLGFDVDMQPYHKLGFVRFKQGGKTWIGSAGGSLLFDINPNTGTGTTAGQVLNSVGKVYTTNWVTGSDSSITEFRATQVPPGEGPTAPGYNTDLVFRTAAAPIRPGSFQIIGQMLDGQVFNVTADSAGKISHPRVVGAIDYEVGVVWLFFVKRTYDADKAFVADFSFLGISGLGLAELDFCNITTLRYNAVSYSYLPLDANVLGIDPVRLPSDGKVPIFRDGSFAVVGNTQTLSPQTVNNLQTVSCGRTRLSRVRVIQDNGLTATTGYTANLDAGTVTFTDVSTYNQPIRIEHRVEDMAMVSDAQISGQLTFTRPVTHYYPAGTSYVSSALVAGDLRSRVQMVFDQASWNGTWSDLLVGSQATASYNHTTFPVTVTNAGAVTERWIVRFTSTTAFEIIGENVGVIATGNTSNDCAPLNPVTNEAYFTINKLGWGSGWAAGNILRINTIGAQYPVWAVRTVLQGPETIIDDSFTLLVRGDVDAP